MHYGLDGGPQAQRRSLVWPFLFCFLLCRLLMPLPPERAHRDMLERVGVVCISDTNGQHRKLTIPKADILIHSGGFARTESELADFNSWLGSLRVTTKIVIAGENDPEVFDYSYRDSKCLCCPVGQLLDVCPNDKVRNCVCDRRPSCCEGDDPMRWDQQCVDLLPRCGVKCASCYPNRTILSNAIVLQDTQAMVEGLKIYGSSWQSAYRNRMFYLKRGKKIAEKWALIPEDLDILVTHTPPYGRGDRFHTAFVPESSGFFPRVAFRHLHRAFHPAKRVVPPLAVNDTLNDGTPAGDNELLLRTNVVKPRLHIFGQATSGRGIYRSGTGDQVSISINAVMVDPKTNNVHQPIFWPIRRTRKLQNPIHIE